MRYEINRENLQGAYLKLKHYYYYYGSSLFLKKQMLEFEKNWSNQFEFDKYFDSLADFFNYEMARKVDNERLKGFSVSYTLYPKKDKISLRALNDVVVDEVNVFIDMPIALHLIDVLFVMNIYDVSSERFESDLMFGTVFGEEYKESECKEKTPVLFENHCAFYDKWKEKPLKEFLKLEDEHSILVKFDLQRCFYNFNFDIGSFINEVFQDESENLICKLEREIHNYYSSVFFREFRKFEKGINKSILPIGLLSSSVILNYYLSPIDRSFNELSLSYGRYADDFLLLCKYQDGLSNIKSDKELLLAMFPGMFESEGERFVLNVGNKKLLVNQSKIKISLEKKRDFAGFVEDLKACSSASFGFFDEKDRETPVDSKVMSIAKVRSWIHDFSIDESQIKAFFRNLNDAELINSYPLWKEIIALDHSLFQNIRNAIEHLVINSDDVFLAGKHIERLKRNLLAELRVAKKCSENGNGYKNHYLVDIRQNDVFMYAENFRGWRYKCFPAVLTKSDLMSYLQIVKRDRVDESLDKKVSDLFEEINFLLPRKETTYEIYSCDGPMLIRHRFGNRKEKVLIAVANLNIGEDEIEDYDLRRTPWGNAKYRSICNIIDQASRQGASYVLLPEFAVQNDHVLDVIRLCHNRNISLVSGLSHYCFRDRGIEKAYNYTLIYSHPLKKPFIHEKRYLAPKEREMLEKHNIMGFDSSNNYLIIDDGLLIYSVMTCYETTNIVDRAMFKNRGIDCVFFPVFNKDINHFSSIVESFSRDINAYIIQSNTNAFGDSRITGPFETVKKDLIKVKGGVNDYFVIGELKFDDREAMRAFEDEALNIRKNIVVSGDFKEIKNYVKKPPKADWKKRSADVSSQILDCGHPFDDCDF